MAIPYLTGTLRGAIIKENEVIILTDPLIHIPENYFPKGTGAIIVIPSSKDILIHPIHYPIKNDSENHISRINASDQPEYLLEDDELVFKEWTPDKGIHHHIETYKVDDLINQKTKKEYEDRIMTK